LPFSIFEREPKLTARKRAVNVRDEGLRCWRMVAPATEVDDAENTFMPRFAELLQAHGPGAEV
jgi:hypothetical protein